MEVKFLNIITIPRLQVLRWVTESLTKTLSLQGQQRNHQNLQKHLLVQNLKSLFWFDLPWRWSRFVFKLSHSAETDHLSRPQSVKLIPFSETSKGGWTVLTGLSLFMWDFTSCGTTEKIKTLGWSNKVNSGFTAALGLVLLLPPFLCLYLTHFLLFKGKLSHTHHPPLGLHTSPTIRRGSEA